MDTNKPLYAWRGRFRFYAVVVVIITANAALGSTIAAIANWLTNFLVQHPELI
jgi:hypothetical protein